MKTKIKYNSLYFLASLGAGGLSVSFFMYLMFLVPHKGTPLATYNHIVPVLLKMDWLSVISAISLVFILLFAFFHFKLLIWNLKEFSKFKDSKEYNDLVKTNAGVQLMARPLTLGMTINVGFVLGAVFVPGLWGIVEYLFPFALIAFWLVGISALKTYLGYFHNTILAGNFDIDKNNNLSQLLAIFAFSMIAVGMAAPGAMSHNITINAIGLGSSLFFLTISIILLFIKLTLGFKGIFKNGIGEEMTPTIWIMIPILTLIGITLVRVSFGLDHHFDYEMPKSNLFVLTTIVLSVQVLFGMIGYTVMKEKKYFEKHVFTEGKVPASFALICPGVAFTVFGFFFINFGLTFNGVLDKYSLMYFILMLPFMFVQYRTVKYFFILKKKHLL